MQFCSVTLTLIVNAVVLTNQKFVTTAPRTKTAKTLLLMGSGNETIVKLNVVHTTN